MIATGFVLLRGKNRSHCTRSCLYLYTQQATSCNKSLGYHLIKTKIECSNDNRHIAVLHRVLSSIRVPHNLTPHAQDMPLAYWICPLYARVLTYCSSNIVTQVLIRVEMIVRTSRIATCRCAVIRVKLISGREVAQDPDFTGTGAHWSTCGSVSRPLVILWLIGKKEI